MDALVFEDFQQLVQEDGVEFADLIDEEDAAMSVRDKAGLRLRDSFIGELLPRALIQWVVHGADQGVRHVAAVPAQCRAVALDEGGVFLKYGVGLLLRLFEYKARCGGLADAGRAVE